LILPGRVADYEPALLDELTASGEVTWVGHASLPGNDGWVSLHLGDQAPLTLPLPETEPAGELQRAVLEALTPGGAWFFRQLQATTGGSDRDLAEALWELVWAGRVTNDTFAPLRALSGSGGGTHRSRRATPRARPSRSTVRSAPPTTTGRWALLPEVDPDPTRRAHATAERMLERYGVVTRGAVMSERTTGGFAAVYKVLSAFEDSGRCRRGYFVEGLGAAQFGTAGAIDRLRTFTEVGDDQAKPTAVTLAATDPANPFGAALPWPERETSGGHRPGRKAGALVVLVDGALTLYVERGGRTLLTWSDDGALLRPAALALSEAGRRGALGRMTVEKADGEQILGGGSTPLREALDAAGFVSTPRGLRLRG
jgi:ATP-dependent Lhr-like helicase